MGNNSFAAPKELNSHRNVCGNVYEVKFVFTTTMSRGDVFALMAVVKLQQWTFCEA